MKVAVMQSNFIPWRGYFDLIDDVDLFIFYDDVQYTTNDWRNRNRIKTEYGTTWTTVPVLFRFSQRQTIECVQINYQQDWISKVMGSIKRAYAESPFFEEYFPKLCEIVEQRFGTISKLNIALIKWVMAILGITTPTMLSSEFKSSGQKTDRLIQILKQVQATSYLSSPTAKVYLEPEKFEAAGIQLEYKVYEYSEYPQRYGAFDSHVSIVDLLFNMGSDSRSHLKSLKTHEKVLVS